MSVPFSITHLRVPQGFGPILEGLAREVLRDQPEDIPKYAAQYFDALLKQREDSGMDPAEWATKQEDTYNNNAFKAAGAIPEKDPETEMTISKDKSFEYQTEDESETLNISTTQPNVSEEVDLTASAEEYEEEHDMTEKHVISLETGISEEETGNMLPDADVQPDDVSGPEEKNPTITTFDHVDRAANGKDSSSASDHDMPQSELEPTDLSSFRAIIKVDVCSQELGTAEDEEGGDEQETAVVDEEIVDSEGVKKTEQVEAFPYSGLAGVDVCATELGATERITDGATAEDDDDNSQPQPEETETPECNQHEANDQVEKAKEEEATETEASPGGINEDLAHIKGGLHINAIPKKDSLVEISFEDVPEDQQIKEVEEKQSEEEGSVKVLQNKILEMQQEEESKEVTVMSTDQNISRTQDQDELEMMGVEKAVNSEGGVTESQREAFHIMKEMVDTNTNDFNLYDSDDDDDDEKRKGVKTSSSHQPTSEADEENPEDETDQNEHNGKIREGEFHQNEDSEEEAKSNNPDDKKDETTDTVGEDKGDIHAEVYSEVGDHSPQVTWSNVSTAATESETLEASAQLPPEENEEGQRTLVESQPEDAVVEKERSSEAEDLVEEGEIDSEIQKKSDAMCEEGSSIPTESADRPAASHQGEERPLEKDSTEPEGKSGDKDECSRPQEEEDIMDIPLDDPEANRAAAKIQAGFRGHMTRKKMKPEDKAEAEERQEDRGQ